MASEHDPPGRAARLGRLVRRLARIAPVRGRAARGTEGDDPAEADRVGESRTAATGAGAGTRPGSGSEAEPDSGTEHEAAAAAGADAPSTAAGPASPTSSADGAGAASPAGRGRRLVRRVLRTGSGDAPPRFKPTPLGLVGGAAAAMFIMLLLIQTVMGTLGAGGPENGSDSRSGPPATAAAPSEGTSRIMIAGDSIVQGSSGDFTWRYRLWRHLDGRSEREVDFVGPYDVLFDATTGGQGSTGYADADFDTDHAGRWGATAAELAGDIGPQVAEHDPHYLLFMAGVNDFARGRSVEDALSAVRGAITSARGAKGGIRVVLGEVTPVEGSGSGEELNTRIARFNAALPDLAARMSGDRSPVVVARTAADFAPAQDTWDGTHPDARGELKIAAAFADALAEDLRLGEPFPRPLPEVRTGPRTAPEVGAEPTRAAWG